MRELGYSTERIEKMKNKKAQKTMQELLGARVSVWESDYQDGEWCIPECLVYEYVMEIIESYEKE